MTSLPQMQIKNLCKLDKNDITPTDANQNVSKITKHKLVTLNYRILSLLDNRTCFESWHNAKP